MIIYALGQILPEQRGELTAVLIQQSGHLGAFLYPTFSDETLHLTGPRSIGANVERVYIGISHQAGEGVAKMANLGEDLHSIDTLAVTPYFVGMAENVRSRVQLFEGKAKF